MIKEIDLKLCMTLNPMQAIICASNHRYNVLGQYRQTQYTNSQRNSYTGQCNNININHTSNQTIDANSASDICTGPFHSII